METDQLNGLIALKIVAERKNFTKAAQILGVTPSAISQSIKQLEIRLGVNLLQRTTRSTSLSETGARFLEEAGPALDQLLISMENLGRHSPQPSGNLRINLSRSIYSMLAGLFASFLKQHPDISLELFFDDDLSDVVAGGFDAGIRLSEMMARDVVSLRLLGPVRFVTAASPKYLNKRGRPKHPKDLLHHDCIRLRIGENDFYDRWEFETKGKDFEVQVRGRMILNDSNLTVTAALQGSGIIYCADTSIVSELRSGKLELILENYAATSGGFYLYYPSRSQIHPKLRAFIDHVKKFRDEI
ncbi:MAG: LysR family transcriptional regulator [Proteobacteria bacterium]|nr:MAG: LysR family transcriptional regulator [Pseudomonadota bacterium]